MARLLMEMQRTSRHAELINRLLPLFTASTPPLTSDDQPKGPSDEPSATVLIEPLSEREVQVLACLADGCSNTEIAQKLVISLTTVKWHTTHIYAKLGVKNRVEAINRARSLGILAA